MSAEEKTILGQGSRVSVALMVAILGLVSTGLWSARGWQADVEARLPPPGWAAGMDVRIKNIERDLAQALVAADRWTGKDMKAWTDRLGDLNQDLKVPPVGHRE